MDQLYDKAAVSTRDWLIDDLGDSINQYDLAARIIEIIEEEWGTVNRDMCHEFWLMTLPQLKFFLTRIARWLPDPANED